MLVPLKSFFLSCACFWPLFLFFICRLHRSIFSVHQPLVSDPQLLFSISFSTPTFNLSFPVISLFSLIFKLTSFFLTFSFFFICCSSLCSCLWFYFSLTAIFSFFFDDLVLLVVTSLILHFIISSAPIKHVHLKSAHLPPPQLYSSFTHHPTNPLSLPVLYSSIFIIAPSNFIVFFSGFFFATISTGTSRVRVGIGCLLCVRGMFPPNSCRELLSVTCSASYPTRGRVTESCLSVLKLLS